MSILIQPNLASELSSGSIAAPVAWFMPDHCGYIAADGRTFRQASPSITETEAMLAFVGRPVKYFPRMTTDARCALGAARLALEAARWAPSATCEIGLVAAGYEGCLQANQNYFRDYVTAGRSMGRGNLFIYTLPTSTLGEVAIALGLTGPSLHIHDDRSPLTGLFKHAQPLVTDGEAAGMLCLWSSPTAAVCFAIDSRTRAMDNFDQIGPLQLAGRLRALVPSSGGPGEG